MSETRCFHLSVLVTATSGIFVCVGGIGDLYKLLDYMTGDSLMTHQLPLASEAVKPDLLAQHPWLAEIEGMDTVHDEATLTAWLAAVVPQYGEWHQCTPNPAAWGSHNPIEDYVAAGGDPSKMVIVELDAVSDE